ncbi:putative O-succinylhomoserine sulfhydrylase [Neisseria polysaccharea ATCC 43768]|nr:putative O-succinylhomoserine sulfhydrylase [Neisseria polysaccharea ATCC 43768]
MPVRLERRTERAQNINKLNNGRAPRCRTDKTEELPMSKKLHPQTLAIRGGKEQTGYREHNQALFLTSSFMWDNAQHAADLFSKKSKGLLIPVPPTRPQPPLKNASPLWKARNARSPLRRVCLRFRRRFLPFCRRAIMWFPAAACSARPSALSITSLPNSASK